MPQPDALDQTLAALNTPSSPAASPPSGRSGSGAPSSPSSASSGRGGDAPQAEGAAGSAIAGITDMASFGLLDEASGLLETLGVTAGTDAKSVWSSGKSFGSTLADNIAYERALAKADQSAHPYAYTTGQVGGAFLVPASRGAKGALQVAREGAVQGALYGAGSGDGTGDRAEKAAEGGVMGAAVSTVLHPVINAVGALGRKLLGRQAPGVASATGRGAKAAEETAAPAGGALTPEQLAAEQADHPEGLVGEVTDDSAALATPPPLPTAHATSTPDANGNTQPVAIMDHTPDTPASADANSGSAGEGAEPVDLDGGGTISRAGLQDLQSQVANLRANVNATDGRAVDITSDSPEHPRLGAFRLGNLGDTPETMSLLGALTRQLDGLPKLSDQEFAQQVQAAARDFGAGDHEAVGALAQQIAGPGGRPDLAIGLLRTVQRTAADSVDLFHGAGIDWSTASPEMVEQAGQAIYNVQQLNQLVQSAKVGAGRALRVFQLPNSEAYLAAMAKGESLGTPPGMNPQRSIPPLPATPEELSNFFELWGMTKKDPQLQSALLSGSIAVPPAGKYLASSAANFFTANILSSSKTVMLNVVGPTLINGIRAMEKMTGAGVLALDPTISQAERAQFLATAKAAPLNLLQMFGDVRDAFRYGVQSFKDNQSIVGGGGTVRDANVTFGPYNRNLLHAADVDPDLRYSLGNLINVWPKAFARVNAGLDEMAKRLTYMGEMRVRAYADAAGQGLSGQDVRDFVTKRLTDATDEAGRATDEGVLAAAERTTLTGPIGTDDNAARRFGTFVQGIRSDYPLTRFILPVFNVPANSIGETMKRLPGVNLLPGMASHVADLAGDNGAVAQAEAHGRTLLGSAFLTAGYLMNQAGVLTGSGPRDAADARIWRQTHEPYSIRVGDTWVSYRKADILGGLLSIPATLADASVYRKADMAQDRMVAGAIGSLAVWFKDQASMRTATQLLAFGDDPTANPSKTVEALFGQVAAGMAAPALVRTLGVDAVDPYTRMRNGWQDFVKASLPGLSEELEPLRNVFGEPVNRTNNSVGEAIFPVSLAPVSTYEKAPELDELSRLYHHTGYAAGTDPRAALGRFADPQDVKLEDGISLYSHLLQARATFKLDGMTLKEAVGDLIHSPEYLAGVDADAGQGSTSTGEATRSYMMRQLFERYGKAIQANVAATSPKALAYLTAAAAKLHDDAYLSTIPIDQLASNPGLYAANGIDPQPYSDRITEGAPAGELLDALNGDGR